MTQVESQRGAQVRCLLLMDGEVKHMVTQWLMWGLQLSVFPYFRSSADESLENSTVSNNFSCPFLCRYDPAFVKHSRVTQETLS